jgi:hypothetical protein
MALHEALAVYFLVFFALAYYRPVYMFKEDGSPRELGTGHEETLLPVHHAAIIAAVLVYAFNQKGK